MYFCYHCLINITFCAIGTMLTIVKFNWKINKLFKSRTFVRNTNKNQAGWKKCQDWAQLLSERSFTLFKTQVPADLRCNKKCTVHRETNHHKHCVWTVILWQCGRPPVPCAKGTDTGWDLKLRRGRGLNKDAVPDKCWVSQCSLRHQCPFIAQAPTVTGSKLDIIVNQGEAKEWHHELNDYYPSDNDLRTASSGQQTH